MARTIGARFVAATLPFLMLVSAAPSPLYNGLFGDLRNTNFVSGATFPSLSAPPVATTWYPDLAASPPYVTINPFAGGAGSILVSSDNTVYSITNLADAIQAYTVLQNGSIGSITVASLASMTRYNWLPTPLPPLLSPVPIGSRAELTLYFAFTARIRDSMPVQIANVVVALDARSLAMIWIREIVPVDPSDVPRSLILSADGATLVLATVNGNSYNSTITVIDPATGTVTRDAQLPSNITACEGGSPWVGTSVLLESTTRDAAPLLVITYGPNNGIPAFGSGCVYAVRLSGELIWAIPETTRTAPISTSGLSLPTGSADVIVLTNRGALGLDRLSGAPVFNTSWGSLGSSSGISLDVWGTALAPLASAPAGTPSVALMALTAWGKSWPAATVRAVDEVTGALLASRNIPHYADAGYNGYGALLAAKPTNGSGAALLVRGTNSLDASAYASVTDAPDDAFDSITLDYVFSCDTTPAGVAAACTFTPQGERRGTFDGTVPGGAMLPLAGNGLLRVSTVNMQTMSGRA